ncbi:MAG: HD domain-containing protein [Acidimicrobiales bacterium]|nr:HD domain-containing protein [Acidimicrobiales bacterium]
MSQGNGASEEQVWRPKPWVAFGVKALIVGAPMLLAFWVTRVLGDALGPSSDTVGRVARIALLVLASVSVYAATDRLVRRLSPLSTMLKLSLIFPAERPSRLRIALRTGSDAQLRQRIRDVAEHGLGATPAEATERLLELVAALNVHDRLTRGHCERVRVLTDLMAVELGLGKEDRSRLQWAALLHDIGKLVVPAEILNKTSRLTDDEFSVIKLHPAAGYKLVEPLREWLGPWSLAVLEHHERWDGGGYPRGLAGTEISLAGRIVCVTDTYDVITSARSYKRPMSAAAARAELARCAGGQFDPAMVKAFLRIGQQRTRFAGGLLSWLPNLPGSVGQVATQVASNTATASLATVTVAAAAVAVPSLPLTAPDASATEAAAAMVVEQPPLQPIEVLPPLLPPLPGTAVDPAAPVTETTAPPLPAGVAAPLELGPLTTLPPAAPMSAPTTTTSIATATLPPTAPAQPAPTDRPPVAGRDLVTGPAGRALSVDVAANDSDPDGQALVVHDARIVSGEGDLSRRGNVLTVDPDDDDHDRDHDHDRDRDGVREVVVEYVVADVDGRARTTGQAVFRFEPAPHPAPAQPTLMVAKAADRSAAVPLEGMTLRPDDVICIFVATGPRYHRVDFWLDDREMRGPRVNREEHHPYDYAGSLHGDSGSPCVPRPAAGLVGPPGQHAITALATGTDRTTKVVAHASFTVSG